MTVDRYVTRARCNGCGHEWTPSNGRTPLKCVGKPQGCGRSTAVEILEWRPAPWDVVNCALDGPHVVGRCSVQAKSIVIYGAPDGGRARDVVLHYDPRVRESAS